MKKLLTMIGFALIAISASAANEVTETTTWSFDNMTVGDVITAVQDINGMYVRATEQKGHSATFISNRLKGTYSDGTKWSSKVALQLSANKGFQVSENTKVDNSAESGNDRCVGIKTTKPGTLYIALRSKTADATRELKLFFNGQVVKTLNCKEVNEMQNSLTTLEYKADKAGTFFLGGSGIMVICNARFVPAE